MLRRTFALMAVVALAVWVVPAYAAEDKGGTHEGTVVKAGDGKLTMTGKDDKKEHTHAIGADVKVTIDGKDAKLEDLKAGQTIRVTTEKKGDKVQVTKIEAKKS